ncbi:hypothetical protein Q5H93_04090 [Hymenobacter sp. ASUV-10]|uniref:Gliding motility-associated protein GldM N-terminal domain-containing protein n=1 Tax=Hymenobacter aranciens TaxID=3063996 RepID=A0ABT9B6W9_9BACT|nr:hypothetical protein [Hymenobacter sp. ASUV-10]MDO7873902.1 hypothetical protein [Hymenobacter sp. ASUV-10]
MTKRNRWLTAGLLLIGAGGVAAVAHSRQQAAMWMQFEQLDRSITRRNQEAARQAANTVRQIRNAVCQNKNMARDMVILRQSELILTRTQIVIDSIQRVRQQLLAATDNLHGEELRHPDAAGAVAELLRNGTAKRLQQQLDSYVTFIKDFVPDAASPTQPLPGWQKPGRNDNWFGRFYFENTSTAAALANLTRFEAMLRQYESDALQVLAAKVGSSWMVFDKIGAVAVPAAATVPPGAMYHAKLMLATAAHGIRFQSVRANGQEGTINQMTGQGFISFRVPAWQPGQPDTVRAQWQGELTTKGQGCGSDTTWRLTVPYLIVKP